MIKASEDANTEYWDIKNLHEQSNFSRDGLTTPIVWNLHGNINKIDTIILTTQKYNQLYTEDINKSEYPSALKMLQNIISSHSLLFIGFSLDDDFIVNQLKKVIEIFGGNTHEHYILLKQGYDVDTLGGNIKIIEYEDHGKALIDKINSLIPTPRPPSQTITEPLATAYIEDKITGNVPLDSRLYIEREDVRAYDYLDNDNALISIKAPRQYGKTSLFIRLIEKAREEGYKVVSLSFQLLSKDILEDLDKLINYGNHSPLDKNNQTRI